MELFVTAVVLVVFALCLDALSLSRSEFWLVLRKHNSCDLKTYNQVEESKHFNATFVYCLDGNWDCYKSIDVKSDKDAIYIGRAFPFALLVRPIKIEKHNLILEGTRKYWLSTRYVYSVAGTGRIKIALPNPLEEVNQILTETTQ